MKLAFPHPASGAAGGAATPDWWHRDHPVFVPLSGFFAGLAFVLLVPALFGGVLEAFLPRHTVEDLFPLVLLALAVPIGLVTAPRTRRLGLYFALGMAATAAVVLGVGWVALQLMIALS